MSCLSIGRACLFVVLFASGVFWHADTAAAQDTFTLVVMTEDQLDRYLEALPEILATGAELGPSTDSENVEYWDAMFDIAARHGFTNYEDFAYLAATIATLVTGMDPNTMEFTEPVVVLEQNVDYLTQLISEERERLLSGPPSENPDTEPAQLLPLLSMLDDLKAGRDVLPKTTDPENIRLIKTYYPELMRLSSLQRDSQ